MAIKGRKKGIVTAQVSSMLRQDTSVVDDLTGASLVLKEFTSCIRTPKYQIIPLELLALWLPRLVLL